MGTETTVEDVLAALASWASSIDDLNPETEWVSPRVEDGRLVNRRLLSV